MVETPIVARKPCPERMTCPLMKRLADRDTTDEQYNRGVTETCAKCQSADAIPRLYTQDDLVELIGYAFLELVPWNNRPIIIRKAIERFLSKHNKRGTIS